MATPTFKEYTATLPPVKRSGPLVDRRSPRYLADRLHHDGIVDRVDRTVPDSVPL